MSIGSWQFLQRRDLLERVASKTEHTRVVVDHIVQIFVAKETSCVHILWLFINVGIVAI